MISTLNLFLHPLEDDDFKGSRWKMIKYSITSLALNGLTFLYWNCLQLHRDLLKDVYISALVSVDFS